jgi:hypothetical protein
VALNICAFDADIHGFLRRSIAWQRNCKNQPREMRILSNRWPSEFHRSFFGVAALSPLTALTAAVCLLTGCGSPKAAPAVPTPEVEVAGVVQKDVPIVSEWVATLDGYVNAQVQPQVAGYVIRQSYKEGSRHSSRRLKHNLAKRKWM